MNNITQIPYLIVELANSHAGSKEHVEELISRFGHIDYQKRGIKFQIFRPETIALPDFKWYPVYKELFFDKATWSELIDKAAHQGEVWIDAFDVYAIEIIENNIDKIYGLKLQASVLQNMEVQNALKKINVRNKKLILNISGFDLQAAQRIVTIFSEISDEIIIQFGFQSYPTKIQDTGLNKIQVLKAAFPLKKLCIADHSDANSSFALNAPIYAAILGCDYIEKHFCLDRKSAKYDGFSALEIDELNKMCSALKDAFVAAGSLFISEAEGDYLSQSIQAPILKRNVDAGELISISDLLYRRTSQVGLSFDEILSMQTGWSILREVKTANSTISKSDFRKAKVAVIVAGRMKSSRLPQKAILPIVGVASVERCLAQCQAVKGIDHLILATSSLDSDDVLKKYTLGGSVLLWKGDPDDVICRYLGACDHYGIDVVVRITADCPLVLPEVIDYLLQKHFESGADYTAAEDCAVGSSGEIINVSALRKIRSHFGRAELSEYMTWYFRNNPECFKLNIEKLPEKWVRDYRLTLDYSEDLQMLEALFNKLGGESRPYSADEVFKLLDDSPEISSLNKHLTLQYRTDKELIALLNSKTKMH